MVVCILFFDFGVVANFVCDCLTCAMGVVVEKLFNCVLLYGSVWVLLFKVRYCCFYLTTQICYYIGLFNMKKIQLCYIGCIGINYHLSSSPLCTSFW